MMEKPKGAWRGDYHLFEIWDGKRKVAGTAARTEEEARAIAMRMLGPHSMLLRYVDIGLATYDAWRADVEEIIESHTPNGLPVGPQALEAYFNEGLTPHDAAEAAAAMAGVEFDCP
jgi:hypothetical protein